MAEFLSAASYLPHEAPMVLVDQVCHVDDTQVICQVQVDPQGILKPFLDEQGNLPCWYAVEIMAQTIGVWSGWHCMQSGCLPKLGMLLGARAFSCMQAFFSTGSMLNVKAQLLLQDDRIGSFECEVNVQGTPVAKARLTTYQPEDADLLQLFAKLGEN